MNIWVSLVANEWEMLVQRFPDLVVDEFTVMPNHLHGILMIMESAGVGKCCTISVGARQEGSILSREASLASPLPTSPPSLGTIIAAYKSTTTRLINGLRHTRGERVWQRNYYDHIIHNEAELQRVRDYIQMNPQKWDLDRENPARSH